jgi:hypothetical protein
MKNLNILRTLIREELAKLREDHNQMENYMFFQNVKSINDATSQILQMDPGYVDSILSDWHQWAVDHIATSADDVSEVVSFLSNRPSLNENRSVGEADSDLDSIISSVDSITSSAKELKRYDFSTLFLNYEQREMLNQAATILRQAAPILESLVDAVDEASAQSDQAGNEPDYIDERKLNKKGFTSKYDNDPKLKGKQKNLPDALQAKITKSK